MYLSVDIFRRYCHKGALFFTFGYKVSKDASSFKNMLFMAYHV